MKMIDKKNKAPERRHVVVVLGVLDEYISLSRMEEIIVGARERIQLENIIEHTVRLDVCVDRGYYDDHTS